MKHYLLKLTQAELDMLRHFAEISRDDFEGGDFGAEYLSPQEKAAATRMFRKLDALWGGGGVLAQPNGGEDGVPG